jgi:hypothetical protein
VSAGPPWLKVDATYSIGSSTQNGSVNTSGSATTVTRTSASQAVLQSKQSVVARLEVWPVTYTQTFGATVVVDADLSPNDKYAHLADMFPDPSVRTFPIAGSVTISDASEGKTEQLDDPGATCPSGQTGVVHSQYHPSADRPLLQRQGTQ